VKLLDVMKCYLDFQNNLLGLVTAALEHINAKHYLKTNCHLTDVKQSKDSATHMKQSFKNYEKKMQ